MELKGLKGIYSECFKYVTKHLSRDQFAELLDEALHDYVDSDWDEDGEYDSEYDWYQDYGRGEAEHQLVQAEVNRFIKEKGLNRESFYDDDSDQSHELHIELQCWYGYDY